MTAVLTTGSVIKCSMAVPPGISTLLVPPTPASASMMPVANITMNKPVVNIPTFGMCNSTTNPTVITATAAAVGVHTPMPCLPAIAGPWDKGAANITLSGIQAATKDSTCTCTWGGTVSVVTTSGLPMQNV